MSVDVFVSVYAKDTIADKYVNISPRDIDNKPITFIWGKRAYAHMIEEYFSHVEKLSDFGIEKEDYCDYRYYTMRCSYDDYEIKDRIVYLHKEFHDEYKEYGSITDIEGYWTEDETAKAVLTESEYSALPLLPPLNITIDGKDVAVNYDNINVTGVTKSDYTPVLYDNYENNEYILNTFKNQTIAWVNKLRYNEAYKNIDLSEVVLLAEMSY